MNTEKKPLAKTNTHKGGKHPPLSEQIATSLEAQILKIHEEGKRLPSELTLSKEYGVSRSVIREAMNTLKGRGLITTHAGGRSRITIPESDSISQAVGRVVKFHGVSDLKITEVRYILESAAAAAAAKNATADDIEKLMTIVDRMILYKKDPKTRARLDCEFHYAIAEMSRNELLSFMLQSIMSNLMVYIQKRLETNPAGNERGIAEHRKIIQAIEAHNHILAQKRMERHIEISFRELADTI
jgi:GntR family transcriptional repressor for pyruvate dehydrogenase complex